MGVLRMMAVLRQKEHLRSDDLNVSQKAIDSVLDRTGLGRRTTQDIRVEHVETRSTADLLAAVRKLLPAPAIEGEFREVVADEG